MLLLVVCLATGTNQIGLCALKLRRWKVIGGLPRLRQMIGSAAACELVILIDGPSGSNSGFWNELPLIEGISNNILGWWLALSPPSFFFVSVFLSCLFHVTPPLKVNSSQPNAHYGKLTQGLK